MDGWEEKAIGGKEEQMKGKENVTRKGSKMRKMEEKSKVAGK